MGVRRSSSEAELPDVSITLTLPCKQYDHPPYSGLTKSSNLRPWTVILIAIGNWPTLASERSVYNMLWPRAGCQ